MVVVSAEVLVCGSMVSSSEPRLMVMVVFFIFLAASHGMTPAAIRDNAASASSSFLMASSFSLIPGKAVSHSGCRRVLLRAYGLCTRRAPPLRLVLEHAERGKFRLHPGFFLGRWRQDGPACRTDGTSQ